MRFLKENKKAFEDFWMKYPALMSGLILLLGTAHGLNPQIIYPIFLISLCIFSVKKRIILFLFLFTAAFLMTSYRYPSVQLPQEKIKGVGTFSISSLKSQQSPFQRSLVYKGMLDFEGQEGFSASRLPCQIYLPSSSHYPPADCDYVIEGTLVQKREHFFVLKPDKKIPWKPIARTFSLAKWRFLAKQAVYDYLKRHIPDTQPQIFLNALATGEVDERILSLEFGRLGMQHILAISGFHFALIALFFGFLFRLIFSHRVSAILLLILLSSYFFFLGNSPSIQRAWLAIFIILVGQLFHLRTSALNALGIGLWIEILTDPLLLNHIGFQLSFLCTLAILLLYPITLSFFNSLLPKRSLTDLMHMPKLDQHGYIFSSLIRETLAINLAVQIASLPLLLLLFHRFPLIGLAYNLFFPFWASISLLLLCCSLFFSPLHQLNNWWTGAALEISSNPPAILDFTIRCKHIPHYAVILFLAILFTYAIRWHAKQK
jgi:competence protein ComEC